MGDLKLPEDDLVMLESYNHFLLFTPRLPEGILIAFEPLHIVQTPLRMAGNEARRRLAGALSHPDLGHGVLRLTLLPPTLFAGSQQTLASLAWGAAPQECPGEVPSVWGPRFLLLRQGARGRAACTQIDPPAVICHLSKAGAVFSCFRRPLRHLLYFSSCADVTGDRC